MGKKADIKQENKTLIISGELDFSTIMPVFKKSLPLLEKTRELSFDFSQVSSSNSAGLALILEWLKYAKRTQKPIFFLQLSPQLKSLATAVGVDKLISYIQY